jgi:hypothetical protein
MGTEQHRVSSASVGRQWQPALSEQLLAREAKLEAIIDCLKEMARLLERYAQGIMQASYFQGAGTGS